MNNFGFNLTFTILNADGTPRDLTPFLPASGVVTLYVYTQEQTPSLLFYGVCTVINATAGVCTYTVQSGNFPTIGTFDAEIEMTQPASGAEVYCEDTETFSVNVIPRHPNP